MDKFIFKNAPRDLFPAKKRKDITSIDLFKDNFAQLKMQKPASSYKLDAGYI